MPTSTIRNHWRAGTGPRPNCSRPSSIKPTSRSEAFQVAVRSTRIAQVSAEYPRPGELQMKLSIVDLGTVAPGTTETDALADSLAVARHAEMHGFHRVWFAEHHLSRSGASHHP